MVEIQAGAAASTGGFSELKQPGPFFFNSWQGICLGIFMVIEHTAWKEQQNQRHGTNPQATHSDFGWLFQEGRRPTPWGPTLAGEQEEKPGNTGADGRDRTIPSQRLLSQSWAPLSYVSKQEGENPVWWQEPFSSSPPILPSADILPLWTQLLAKHPA